MTENISVIKKVLGNDAFKAVAVFLLAFLVYANSLGNGFVMDDKSIMVDNPVLSGDLVSLFNRIDTTSEQHLLPYYRPFTYITYWVEQRLHGLDPFYVRLFNVMLHSVNALVFFYLARLITGNSFSALMAGIIFAVHPINSEAVDFNSGGRNTMLATFFVLTAYILYKRSASKGLSPSAFAGSVLFLIGMLSKEFAVCLMLIILSQEVLKLRKGECAVSRSILSVFPFFVAVVVYLIMRWQVLSAYGIQSGIIPGLSAERLKDMYYFQDISTRLLNNIYIIPKYFLNIIFPFLLSPKYIVPDDILSHIGVIALGFILIAGGVWFSFKKNRPITVFGLFWFFSFFLPVSGLVVFSSDQMADRYLYAPAMGLWLICSDTFVKYYEGIRRKTLPTLIATALLSAYAAITFQINREWKDDLSIFSRIVRLYPDNPNGHVGLGGAYYELSLNDPIYLKKAEDSFRKAMDLTHYYDGFAPDKRPPMYLQVLSTRMGNIKFMQSDLRSAIEFYSKALMIWPSDLEARINRAMAYERTGAIKEAIRDYEVFLSIPESSLAAEPRLFAIQRLRALSAGGYDKN